MFCDLGDNFHDQRGYAPLLVHTTCLHELSDYDCYVVLVMTSVSCYCQQTIIVTEFQFGVLLSAYPVGMRLIYGSAIPAASNECGSR